MPKKKPKGLKGLVKKLQKVTTASTAAAAPTDSTAAAAPTASTAESHVLAGAMDLAGSAPQPKPPETSKLKK